ncbi:pimeloyl-ACP methyl ester carboxylesterase [Erwinia toletana]|uniref:Pimeloyl-ACP methyl ester carboxylesterase n=1 Tax=Winslowiella toletana TaxID=92490 RepID=A0ABS4P3W6_9GAMM|nr:alpha/beta hydrolase [Winslowiella toletana]MBP2167342.1 pimeloyl-ACP methyl ester carboxylesterase [Winslowiella toletana]
MKYRPLFAWLLSILLFAGAACPLTVTATEQSVSWGQRWQHLPPTPAPVRGLKTGYAKVNGIDLYYGVIGKGSPVIFIHGGLANSDYWGKQVPVIARNHQVIVLDSRGHGRSTRSSQPYGYDLMTDDVVALMDHLHLQKADIVGWSDGAIIGIDLALRHAGRINKVFAFAPNTTTAGVRADVAENPLFASYIARAGEEYQRLSKTPDQYNSFVEQIGHMWETQPNWSDSQLQSIRTPILVADGDHDEGILRPHLEHIAATIPQAGLLIIPNTSHFAFMQAPDEFNDALVNFLDR